MLTLGRIRAMLWTAILAVFVVAVATYAFVSLASSPTPDPQAGRTYEVHWKQYGVSYLTADQGRVLDGISTILILVIVTAVPAVFVIGGIERVRDRRAETKREAPGPGLDGPLKSGRKRR
ncbi:MAG TPA: hypothetical protein VKT80_07980 [Chloroflexota bacterium]|nr:hypothetical protein [Chloroflexota bacterium]